jgi:hypothetical protein
LSDKAAYSPLILLNRKKKIHNENFYFREIKKINLYFLFFYKNIFIKNKIYNYFFILTKFLKFLKIWDRGGMLCPWVQNTGFLGGFEEASAAAEFNPWR